jgi:single-strand DNA-binding protein
MANDINEVIVSGRLGKDSQVFEKVTKFSIAVTKNTKKDAQGNYTSDTDWINCLVFGQVNIAKGTRLKVWGSWCNNNWEKDGVKHYDHQLKVQTYKIFQDKKKENQPQEINQQESYEPDTEFPGEPM